MNWMLNPRDPLPLHAQAEQALRGLIREPVYQQGQLLPDEVGLARRMGVSRSTLRAALDRLVREGLLERRRGVGTRVRPAGTSSNLTAWTSFTREMRALGVEVQTFHCTAVWVRATGEVARALGVDPGTRVLRLDRVRGYHGEPVVYFRSWLHPRLPLQPGDDFQQPLYELIAQRSGVTPVHSEEHLRAVPAKAPIGTWLHVKPGTPLLLRQRRVCDAGGRPLEYALNHYRGDRFTLHLDLHRSPA